MILWHKHTARLPVSDFKKNVGSLRRAAGHSQSWVGEELRKNLALHDTWTLAKICRCRLVPGRI